MKPRYNELKGHSVNRDYAVCELGLGEPANGMKLT